MTASASRPPNFTFPSSPVRQRVLISRRMPARASRPDNLTFSTPRPARLTHPDCEYFPPVGCRREPPGHPTYLSVFTCPTQRVLISRRTPARALPARQPYLFKPVARRGLPVRHGDSEATIGRWQEPPRQTNLPFPSCGRQSLPNHAAG